MRKLLVVLMLALPMAATATCTWTQTDPKNGYVVCTTANESAFASNTSAASGWMFSSCSRGITFFACADSGQTLSGAGTLTVYTYNVVAALWGAYPDQNMTATASGQRCQQFDAKWTAVTSPGRIAVLPIGVTVSGGGLTIYSECN